MNSIVDLPYLSLNFPNIPEHEISKENIIDTVEGFFNADVNVVFLEGEDDIGKTILLSQFCRKNNKNAFSCFLSPTSIYSCDVNLFLSDLSAQIYWHLSNKFIDKDKQINIAFFRELITLLLKKRKYNNDKYYFVIDGLDEAKKFNENFVKEIFDILPLGDNFKFLISGSHKNLKSLMPKSKNIRVNSYPLTGFSLDETINFLKESTFNDSIEKEKVAEIRDICKGYPGRLYNAVRILKESNKTLEDFLLTIEEYDDLFNLDDDKVDYKNSDLVLILAFLSHSDRTFDIEILSKIISLDINYIKELLKNLSFINVGEYISFVSSAHKRYYANKLESLKDEIVEKKISYYLNNIKDGDSLQNLPALYHDLNRWDDIIELLSENNISVLLDKKQSLLVVQKQLEYGFEAADKLGNNSEMLRFSLQKAISKELEDIDIWKAEIEALISIHEVKKAIMIAQSAVINEDRLQLLSALAKKLKDSNEEVPQEILIQIQELYNQIDLNSFGDKVVDLASDLLYVLPNLVIDIVNKSSDSSSTNNINDWLLAKLAFMEFEPKRKLNEELNETVKSISTKISNPNYQKISKAIKYLFGQYSAEEVLTEVRKIEEIQQQLQFLRMWIKVNRECKDLDIILEFSTDLLYSSTYIEIPDSKLLVDLSTPLSEIKDKGSAQKLINKFDGFKESLKNNGPSVNYIQYQLNIFNSEIVFEYDVAINRLYEMYFELEQIKDLYVKVESYTILYSHCIQNAKIIMEKDSILGDVKEELCKNLDLLLQAASLHEDILENFITLVVTYDIELAINYAQKLNTKIRRNIALDKTLTEYLKLSIARIDFEIVKNIYLLTDLSYVKEHMILMVIDKIHSESVDLTISESILLYWFSQIKLILSSITKTIAFVKVINCSQYIYNDGKFIEDGFSELKQSFKNIDSSWDKINTAYLISANLSSKWMSVSKEYVSIAEDEKNKNWLFSPSYAYPYIYNIKLIIKCFGGLINKGGNIENELSNIKNLINKIPSASIQIDLYCDLAYQFHLRNKIESRNDIIESNIKCLFAGIKDISKKIEAITNSSYILYKYHSKYTLTLIEEVPTEFREEIYSNICKFLLTKISPLESFDWNKEFKYKIKFEDALDMLDLIDLMETDSVIYNYVRHLTNSIIQRDLFTKEQISMLTESINDVISKKLPDKSNIPHEGYLIVAEAHLLKAKMNERKNIDNWNKIISRAKLINNVSDKSFVLAVIAEAIPESLINLKQSLFKESCLIIEGIPSYLERIQRYETILEILKKVENSSCASILSNIIQTSLIADSKDVLELQKNTIDFAYSVDPDLANKLIKIIDDDPVRKKNADYIKRHIDTLKLKSDLINNKTPEYDKGDINLDRLPEAFGLMLASLHSGHLTNKKIEELIPWLKKVNNLPFSESYPILLFIIENSVIRHENTDEYLTIIKPFYNALYINAKIHEVVIKKLSGRLIPHNINIGIESSTNFIFNANDREKSIEFVRKWIDNNVDDYIKICDPYFSKVDLELLKIILMLKPECKVIILTSLFEKKTSINYHEEYINEWSKYSEQDPPFTKVIIVWTNPKLSSPFHDRWWITKRNGLRMGTSFNSLGLSKVSEISLLMFDELNKIESECDKYINMDEKYYKGEKLEYQSFRL